MLFHKRAKGKRLAPKKKDTEREKQKSNEGTLQFYKQQLVIIRQLLQKIISYLNDHPAGITIVASGFLAISTFMMKFLSYCYDRGKVSYWSLDTSAIEIFRESIIFDILFSSILASLFLSISFLFYLCLSVPRKDTPFLRHILSLSGFLIVLFLISIALYYLFFSAILGSQVWLLSVANLVFSAIAKFITFLCRNILESRKSIIFSVIIVAVAVFSGLCEMGIRSAQAQRTFPLLNDTQVVVYSTSTTYYTARYTIDGDTILIDTSHRGTYARADGELEYRTFENVVRQE